MTIEKSSSGQKLTKTQKKHKRDEATRLANAMLSNLGKSHEHIQKFSILIDELDNAKDPDARKRPDGKEISSIFDLEIKREKKFILQDWVKKHKEQKTIQTKEKHTVSA